MDYIVDYVIGSSIHANFFSIDIFEDILKSVEACRNLIRYYIHPALREMYNPIYEMLLRGSKVC